MEFNTMKEKVNCWSEEAKTVMSMAPESHHAQDNRAWDKTFTDVNEQNI